MKLSFSRGFALFLLLVSVSSTARAAEPVADCLAKVGSTLEKRAAELDAFYRKSYRSPLKNHAGPELLRGDRTDEAVVLVHGFMTSAPELRALAVELQRKGYTVLLPLLPGFGSSAEAANDSKLTAWRMEVGTDVEMLGACYPKVVVGGLSLGGALATDYVLDAYEPKRETLPFRVSALLLFSPYYDVSSYVARPLSYVLKMFRDSIALSTLQSLSGTTDLAAVISHPEYANTEMPIGALSSVFELSAELKATPDGVTSDVPTELFYSNADTTVDVGLADRFTRAHFPSNRIYAYDKSEKVPHQVTSPEVNPRFAELVESVAGFLEAR